MLVDGRSGLQGGRTVVPCPDAVEAPGRVPCAASERGFRGTWGAPEWGGVSFLIQLAGSDGGHAGSA